MGGGYRVQRSTRLIPPPYLPGPVHTPGRARGRGASGPRGPDNGRRVGSRREVVGNGSVCARAAARPRPPRATSPDDSARRPLDGIQVVGGAPARPRQGTATRLFGRQVPPHAYEAWAYPVYSYVGHGMYRRTTLPNPTTRQKREVWIGGVKLLRVGRDRLTRHFS